MGVVGVGALAGVVAPAIAHAATGSDPAPLDLPAVLAALVLILLAAGAGGWLFRRLGQPAVLGELAGGIVLGNLGLAGWHGLAGLPHLPAIDLLAQIGVLFLLFQIGLESDLAGMMAVGRSSLLVATLGVMAPIALGFVVSSWFLPSHGPLTHVFVGATLCATSVGITARVLRDLGRTASVEGRIILGAAVIDDVMGLVVLAVITGVITSTQAGRSFDAREAGIIVGKALAFLLAAALAGRWVSRHALPFTAGRADAGGRLTLLLALVFCFALAFLAGRLGLAPIVGAFAAGLVLDEAHLRDRSGRDPEVRDIAQLLEPLAAFLVPVFFVLMGMRVDLAVFTRGPAVAFALALTLAAVLSKQVCGLGVLEGGADRWAVGLGMIPRGEVGLIFAGIGATLMVPGGRVVDDATFSAVVMMVAVTTLITPSLLAWRLRRVRG